MNARARLSGDRTISWMFEVKPPFFEHEDYRRPVWHVFKPNSKDTKSGDDGQPSGVSVFQLEPVTSEDAARLRIHLAIADGRTPSNRWGAVELQVGQLTSIASGASLSVSVVEDPLPDTPPGHEACGRAHSLVLGLNPTNARDRKSVVYKTALQQMVDRGNYSELSRLG